MVKIIYILFVSLCLAQDSDVDEVVIPQGLQKILSKDFLSVFTFFLFIFGDKWGN